MEKFKMTTGKQILVYGTLSIIALYFLFLGLAKAKGFLAPLTIALILALLMMPLARKMERSFMNRTAASLTNTFIVLIASVGFMALVSFQIKSVVNQWPQIKDTMQPKIEQYKEFIFEHSPLDKSDLEQSDEGSSDGGSSVPIFGSGGGSQGQQAASFLNQFLSVMGDYLLILIYIFFILNYRHKFKEFLMRLFPDERKSEIKEVIDGSADVTQQYLIGKLILIGLLSILYSIGLGFSGVSNFILVSILAAFLSIIPYLGNVIGFGLALAFGYLTSGETGVLIGIIATFTVGQFFESYILQPYVVGDKVDLNPFLIILVVIIGSMVWGVIGMVVAIPLLAILNVVLNHVGPLKPFGYLFSKDDPEKA
jgi:predicted PurR-regulated permease PerM